MSLGASIPRYTWATATRATSAVAAHLPVRRQRPSGTSVYKIPSRVTESAASCAEGSAQAVHAVRNSTPKGRGRCSIGASTAWIVKPSTIQTSSMTSRCRRRLRITRASSSPHSSTLTAIQEPSAASARMTGSSPGGCNPASHRIIRSSAMVTATAGPCRSPAKTSSDSVTSTTQAVSQPTPVVWRWCGSGGGYPDGRRRRGSTR